MSTFTAPPPTVPRILTQTLNEFVEQQVAEEGCADETAYFAKLAEAEHKRKIRDYYEREVMKAIESDTWVPYTPDFFDKIRAKVEQRLQAKQAGKSA